MMLSKRVGVHLLPDLDQVAVGALHQAVHHFHHVQARAQLLYTVPISRPMMPPPRISMRLGALPSASAPVESTTRGSSGMKGRRTACEPAAMMQRLQT
jgi:hypothetical protein